MNSESNALSNQDLAQQIQSLLSSSPPFIDDNSIKVLVRFSLLSTALYTKPLSLSAESTTTTCYYKYYYN